RVFHRLPDTFEARVFLAMKLERRGREVRQQTEFGALGENDFAGASVLRKYFPRRGLFARHRPPPRSRIVRRGNEAGQQQAERYHGLTTTSVSTGPPSVPSDFLAPQPLSLIAALTGSTRVAGALCGHASSLASESPRPPGNAAWWTVATVWKSE